MMRWGKITTSLIIAVTLTGCSLFSGDKKAEPKIKAPLQSLTTPEVVVEKLWSKSAGSGVSYRIENLRPSLDGEVIFAAGSKGRVYAFDRNTGKQRWKTDVDERIGGGVFAYADAVLMGTLSGEVIALEQEDGRIRWRTEVGSEVLSAPVSDGTYVAVKTVDDGLTVLDADSGSVLWRQEAVQPPLTLRSSGSPLMFTEAVFAGFSNGEARAFRLATGQPLWAVRVANPKGSSELERMVDVAGTPLIADSTIFFDSYQGNAVAVEMFTGRTRWEKPMSSIHNMAEGFGSIYISDEVDFLSSLDQRTGGTNWRQESFKYRKLSAPATISSYVVVGDGDGYLHVLSQVDGRLMGRIKLGDPINAQPLVDGNELFVLTADGDLVALTIKAVE